MFICNTFGLRKAFDTLDHDILIAKLGAYEFKRDSPLLMKIYMQEYCSDDKKVHEEAPRVILINHTRDFVKLLQNNKDISNHHRSILTYMIENSR